MNVLMQNRQDSFHKWGGDTSQMVETKKQLEKLGVEVSIDLSENPDLTDYDLIHIFNLQNPEHGIKQLWHAKNSNKPVVLSSIYWDLYYAKNAKENYLYSEIPLVRSIAKINLNIPHIFSKIIYFKKNLQERNMMKRMLVESDLILPNSYSEMEIMVNQYKIPQLRAKSLIIPNGIRKSKLMNIKSLNIAPLECSEEYVLQVGKIGTWKGQIKLIKALFDFPKIPLVFVGPGLDSYYGKACKKMGTERGNTYFIGEISHDEIYSYYKNAKVHVLPSLRESPGLSTLEAGAYGVNCVVSIHGPVAEYFGLDVFYCEPRNISSIQEAVLQAWESPKNNKLKNKIINEFTWDKAAEITLKAYKHVLV